MEDVREAVADARLALRKKHYKQVVVAVKGMVDAKRYTLNMRKRSSESVWKSVMQSELLGGRHGRRKRKNWSASTAERPAVHNAEARCRLESSDLIPTLNACKPIALTTLHR